MLAPGRQLEVSDCSLLEYPLGSTGDILKQSPHRAFLLLSQIPKKVKTRVRTENVVGRHPKVRAMISTGDGQRLEERDCRCLI